MKVTSKSGQLLFSQLNVNKWRVSFYKNELSIFKNKSYKIVINFIKFIRFLFLFNLEYFIILGWTSTTQNRERFQLWVYETMSGSWNRGK